MNFKALRDISLGSDWRKDLNTVPLTPLTAVIGKNGVGKSSLFDAFGFLSDCLKLGVEEACDQRGRGDFKRIKSMGEDGPILFDIQYRENSEARPITYQLIISLDESGRPFISREVLAELYMEQGEERSYIFLLLLDGKGYCWKGKGVEKKDNSSDMDKLMKEGEGDHEFIELVDKRKLGIATLGAMKDHPRISKFRRFIEGWYLSYFTPDAARTMPLVGAQKHLNSYGDNLGNVVQFMEREHPEKFSSILQKIAEKIPGIDKIDTEETNDGRLLLRFNDKGFKDPFFSPQMSDGTLKLFAYLLLLKDPNPPPFLCIEEPENGLYHKLLEILADEFRRHADTSQVFVTTHQPYLVNALKPEEVWVLEKGEDGFSTIVRASDIPLVKEMADEGLPLGGLWYSDYLDR